VSKYLTVIGDVHGCLHTLQSLLDKIPTADNRIILCGDIINKGKRSYQTAEFVRNNNLECLLGNHEFYCIHRKNPRYSRYWQERGGLTTMASIYDALSPRNEFHLDIYVEQLADFFQTFHRILLINTSFGKKYLLTHGGVSKSFFQKNNFTVANLMQHDFLGLDSPFFNKKPLAVIPGYVQVIGHIPTIFAPKLVHSNYYIDSGAVYATKFGMGYLSAIQFNLEKNEPPQIYQQLNID